jgi:chaperonin cofactor prefoldin
MGYDIEKEPVGQTCPTINAVIRDVNAIYNIIENVDGSNEQDLKDILENMEQIREANSLLRNWGNDLLNRKKELEEELSDKVEEMEKTISDLEENIETYKDEIKRLEKLIEDLEN